MAYSPIRSVADLQQRIVAGVTREDHWLEFKTDLGGDNRETARDVAQFANASGGTVIVGAEEDAEVFARYCGLANPALVAERLDNIVKHHLSPVPIIEIVVLQPQEDRAILVANIPPSTRVVARHENHRSYEFLIRAGQSKRHMPLLEVEARMHGGERLARLRIQQIKTDENIALEAMLSRIDHYGWRLSAVDDDTLTLKKGALDVVIPLAYVNSVYRAKNPGTQWVIDLSCYLTHVTEGGDFLHVSSGKPLHLGESKVYRTRRFHAE